MIPRMRAVVLLLAVATVAGCSRHTATAPTQTPPPSPSPTPAPATLTRVWLCCDTVQFGSQQQIEARAEYSDGSIKVVTSAVTSWRSSNPAMAPISSTGVVSGLAPGDFDITASYGGLDVSLKCSVFQSPYRPPATDEVTGHLSEITAFGPVDLWPAEVEVVGGPANGQKVQTILGGIFRISGLHAAGFDLIVRMRGYAPGRAHVDTLGRELNINLGPAAGTISDVLEGGVCLPTRTMSRTFRPQAPAFLRVTAERDGSTVKSLYANGVLVNGRIFLYQDIELSAGVAYELRVTGDCVNDTGPVRPTSRITFLRPAD
jgi:hypothetical protein